MVFSFVTFTGEAYARPRVMRLIRPIDRITLPSIVDKIKPSPLNVSVAADSPSGGSVLVSSKDVPMMKLNLKAEGSEKIVLQSLVLTKQGTAPDTAITSVKLYDQSNMLLSTSTLSNGRVYLSNIGLIVSNTITPLVVKADFGSTGVGLSIGFQVTDQAAVRASGVKTGMRVPVTGTFPIYGGIFTIIQSPTSGSLSVLRNSAYPDGTFVVGTARVKIGSFVMQADSVEDVRITSIGLSVNNSLNSQTAVSNLFLMCAGCGANGADMQLGQTQPSVNDEVVYYFAPSNFTLVKNTQRVVDIFADTVSNPTSYTINSTIPARGASGVGVASQISLSAPEQNLLLQNMTGLVVVTSGELTVATASVPPSSQIVAGTQHTDPATEVYRVRLTANTTEDIMLETLVFRLDSEADNAAVTQLALYDSNGGLLLSAPLTYDGSDRGGKFLLSQVVSISNTGQDLVIPKGQNRTYVIRFSAANSGQVSVSNKSPQLRLVSVEAKGMASQMVIKDPMIGSGFRESGAKLRAGADDDSGCNLNGSISATATSFLIDNGGAGTCTVQTLPAGTLVSLHSEDMLVTSNTGTMLTVQRGLNNTATEAHPDNTALLYGGLAASSSNTIVPSTAAVLLNPGQIMKIDQEHMEVISTDTVRNLIKVVRGVNHSTVSSHVLDNTSLFEAEALQSNEMRIYNTKPLLAAASDSPSGGTSNTAKVNDVLAKFTVSAQNNLADAAQNEVTLKRIRVTTNAQGVSFSNVNLYPVEGDYIADFAVPADWKSGSVMDFDLSKDGNIKALGYDRVREGMTRTFVIRGTTNAAQNGVYQFKIANLGTDASAVYGLTSDVEWSDGVSTVSWLQQPGFSSVFLNTAPLGFVAHGVVDTVVPTVTGISFGGLANNILDNDDTITITFSEPMSPGTLAGDDTISELRADGLTYVIVPDGQTGDVSLGGNGVITVKNLLSVDIDNQNTVYPTEYVVAATLDTTARILTLKLSRQSGTGVLGSDEEFTNPLTTVAGTARDQAGNAIGLGMTANVSGGI